MYLVAITRPFWRFFPPYCVQADGRTPLEVAYRAGNSALVQKLLTGTVHAANPESCQLACEHLLIFLIVDLGLRAPFGWHSCSGRKLAGCSSWWPCGPTRGHGEVRHVHVAECRDIAADRWTLCSPSAGPRCHVQGAQLYFICVVL
jgi:hypothetical protein